MQTCILLLHGLQISFIDGKMIDFSTTMIFVVALVCVLVALVFVHDYMRKSTRAWALLSKFNGDKGLPIIGNALALGFDSDG